MIVNVRHIFRNPGWAAINALSRPLRATSRRAEAETLENAKGLHGGEGLPVPTGRLSQHLLGRERVVAYHHNVFPYRLGALPCAAT